MFFLFILSGALFFLMLYWLLVSYQPNLTMVVVLASSYNRLENNFHVCEHSELKWNDILCGRTFSGENG